MYVVHISTISEGAVLTYIKMCDELSLSLARIWTRDCHGLQYTKQMTLCFYQKSQKKIFADREVSFFSAKIF